MNALDILFMLIFSVAFFGSLSFILGSALCVVQNLKQSRRTKTFALEETREAIQKKSYPINLAIREILAPDYFIRLSSGQRQLIFASITDAQKLHDLPKLKEAIS